MSATDTSYTRRDYELAERVGTKEAWDFFIATYPHGFYTKLAQAQRNKLLAEQERLAASERAKVVQEEQKIASLLNELKPPSELTLPLKPSPRNKRGLRRN